MSDALGGSAASGARPSQGGTSAAGGAGTAPRAGGPPTAEGGSGAGGSSSSAGFAGSAGADPGAGDALCSESSEFGVHDAVDVWSDARGVHVRVDRSVYSDAGSGWDQLELRDTGPGGLTGFEGGPLVFYGVSNACGIELIDAAGTVHCSGATEPVHVHVVRNDLAYAVYEEYVLVFDGTFWTQRGDALGAPGTIGARQVWADDQTIAVAGDGGLFIAEGAGAFERVTRLDRPDGSPAEFTAVWGLPGGGLWVGGQRGELFEYHLESDDSFVWAPPDSGECARIRDLWGTKDEELFVATDSEVRRVGDLYALLSLPCDGASRVWAIWGNAADDVFIAYEGESHDPPCGEVRLDHFDGMRVRAR